MTPKLLSRVFRAGLLALLLFGNVTLFVPAHAQAPAPAAAGTEAPPAPPHTMLDTFKEGGWVMYPI
ncbi:MAG TPA: MotA/TolQ/ExbB proton channel family protein, partial [Prosthecobacter sp.]|nr:MotA/TolQ/ExbB proton channel family protein [Prosthecobacter sp.]